MKIIGWFISAVFLTGSCTKEFREPIPSPHDLNFSSLPESWDEAVPLGNGMLGALIWRKEGKLRISLDRADLWDLRPTANLDRPEWRFKWVYEQWKNDTYEHVQELFDQPYDRDPAPSKIPAAALELDIATMGPVESVRLYLNHALCEVRWKTGVKLHIFVHATDPVGWFRFTGPTNGISVGLEPPAYNLEGSERNNDPVTGQDLRRLGYPKGQVTRDNNRILLDQQGWKDFTYQVAVKWAETGKAIYGCWSISSEFTGSEKAKKAEKIVSDHWELGFAADLQTHQKWWNTFWGKSSIHIPDSILEKQYYLDIYKFGATARDGAPPVSLQAIWTTDNGRLPPWKGDFHHDLNTQLSYWPAYAGNYLEEESGFLNWLWENKPEFERFTRVYFESPGLNVPGVTTLTGQPMGGWIQYSFGPTVGAWLGHHFYRHWDFSRDTVFLKERAYPWIREVAVYLEAISITGEDGLRKLPISSSPEYQGNSREAWFGKTTNFDLSLIRWIFLKGGELAGILGKTEDAAHWNTILSEWPDLSEYPEEGLLIAPDFPYAGSHRHFSHLLAYHPLGILDFSKGTKDISIVSKSLNALDKYGSDFWTGYSFAWLGNMKARAFDGKGAAEALRIFAAAFCLPNSFHVNGDQSGMNYSKFTYRPFTLEGNFAFAAGIQEMLIQSHTGVIRVFPAIPADWGDVSFNRLRTSGAFLVSSIKKDHRVVEVEVAAERGGLFRMINPFEGHFSLTGSEYNLHADTLEVVMKKNQTVRIQKKSAPPDKPN